MALPIMTYGYSILQKPCSEVPAPSEELDTLIKNMWKCMDLAGGVGLAAPQINSNLKVFIVNSKIMYDDLSDDERKAMFSEDNGIIETFINAKIITTSDKTWSDYEGCLSIPDITEQVERSWEIILEYQDSDFKMHKKLFSGYTAKVIQHEYDHTNGVLFIDHLSLLKKKLLSSKLKKISAGKFKTSYRTKFSN